jgi:hypothetical protein
MPLQTFKKVILAGPEGLAKKTSKFGLKESKAQDKNNIISNRMDVSVLIIDSYLY